MYNLTGYEMIIWFVCVNTLVAILIGNRTVEAFPRFFCMYAMMSWSRWVLWYRFRVDGGELFDKVVSIGQYDEPTAKLMSYQMVCAVKVKLSMM